MQQAIEAGFLAVEADASSEQVLKRVRIERARGFIAAVSTDAENVYAVLTARLLKPDLYIIGRAETDDARAKLVRAGADRVVSPYQIGGLQLAQTALRPAVVDFVQIATSSENLELNMEQVRIHEGSPLAGRSIVDASLRQRFGVVVVGIQRADGRMEFNPPPDTDDARRGSSRRARPPRQAARARGRRRRLRHARSVSRWPRAFSTEPRSRRRSTPRCCRTCSAFTAAAGRPPGLGIVLVGEDPASEIYVRNKVKAGGESGLRVDLRPPARDGHARRAPRHRRSA